MPRPLYSKFVDKAQSALTAAIEIYNKPSFDYREETFAMLATNAWELLLKARVLQLNKNKVSSLHVFAFGKTKLGKPSKRKVAKLNRTGTKLTKGLFECMSLLEERGADDLPSPVRKNLEALCEIRDGSVHYIHASSALAHQVLTVAVAAIKNFIRISIVWFKADLSNRISLMLPLAFISTTAIESVVVSKDESKLISYLAQLVAEDAAHADDFSVAINVDVNSTDPNLETRRKFSFRITQTLSELHSVKRIFANDIRGTTID